MKKKLSALLLCGALLLGMTLTVYAADPVYFPEFSATTGFAMTPNGVWPGVDSNVVPTQTYFGSGLTLNDCLGFVEEYISALEATGEFEVVYPLSVVMGQKDSDFVGYAAELRYTGPAKMKGTLRLTRAGMTWGDYGEYHVDISVDHNEYVSSSDKKNSVTIRWDSALRPEGIDGDTGNGSSLGSEGTNGNTGNGSALPSAGSQTVVLAIGYNKMAVGEQVVQVDEQNENVYPLVEDGRTLVPVSRIVAAFGGVSTWDGATKATTFTVNGRTVNHIVGTNTVTTPTGTKTMEVPSRLMNDRTYVPVRYVLEGLGLWVGYEPKYQLVVVSTEDQSGRDLVKLDEAQRLFASESVPDLPRSFLEHYTIDGYDYTMEVGQSLTLYNSRKAISAYSAYTWDVLDGGELVKVDRNSATCQFYAKRPGVVTIQSHLDETIVNYGGPSTHNEYTYTMTITITAPTAWGETSSLMKWQTCPACGGSGKIQVGTRQETCPTCQGQKQVLKH